ncbi:MAG: response regulator transcription factor [Chloroflexi bacterium]|nr:response regulator transcription factor [Chloroflexota bacterium]
MIGLQLLSPSPAVRAGLRALLAGDEELSFQEPAGTEEAGTGTEVPDVLIVDGEGVAPQAIDGILEDFAGAGIVLLGVPARLAGDWLDRLGGRAWALLRRDAEGQEIAAAVRTVASHLVALDPRLAEQMLAPPKEVGESDTSAADELSPREREVLQLVAQGLSNRAIAGRLYISEHTVKFHVASILAKLGAESRTEAVHLGARQGLVIL